MVQPSACGGGNTRKMIAHGKGFPGKRVRTSKKMLSDKPTMSRGSGRNIGKPGSNRWLMRSD